MNNFIIDAFKKDKTYSGLVKCIKEQSGKKFPLLAGGLCTGAVCAMCASLVSDFPEKTPALLIMPNERDCAALAASFYDYGVKADIYTLRDMVMQNIVASHEFEHERLAVLNDILDRNCDIVITVPDALLQYTIPPETLRSLSMTVNSGQEYDIPELCAFLTACGYSSADTVDSVGQFSRRGGIMDIFPPNLRNPVRIEFFDTEIDRMAQFDVISQRCTESIDSFRITPVREVISSEEKRKELSVLVRNNARKASVERVKDSLYEELETLSSGKELNCIDKYISFVYPEKKCLLDYFDNNSLLMVYEYTQIMNRARAYEWQETESIKSLLAEGLLIPQYSEYSLSKEVLEERIKSTPVLIINSFVSSMASFRFDGVFGFTTKQTANCFDNLAVLYEELYDYRNLGYRVFVLTENRQAAENLSSMLSQSGYTSSLGYDDDGSSIVILPSPRIQGFEFSSIKTAVLSTSRGINSMPAPVSKGRKKSAKDSNTEKVFSYTDLDEGDYVVHEKYGIGRYIGTRSLLVEGARKDFVQIQYAGTDVLYLPCNQLDAISKYIGASGEDVEIKLSKMGGPEWVKAKTKVKAAAKDMAKQLINLYAKRLRLEGHAFPPDSAIEKEFADNFEYDETQGQINAIRDITRDMEASHPMDRLLCGDVGYGKTEVAMRAAFKAVCDGKQVAILVPTTILALQHYETLLSRMRGFPVSIDMLSRFRTAKQQALSLRKIARGETDIIVGTHRILSKDIEFHDLGLIIIDEEQRFGVAQKEKLRQIAENVDTLTLTATPIPRTLNMAMTGIRDMSVLEEAPGDRFPVQSYVTEYDEVIIFDAIKRELRRGGQVFYLCNRIERMEKTAAMISKEIPEARIAVANGQMEKEDLSDIWHSLITGDTDILVCTTIIETGVDVPNANTLIIEDADKMGLSQLHQLRGRVGRSSRRAYSYFTYPKNKVLTEIAAKRLSAIRDFTEFGAGFKVAMRDLEIRGAGNILGAEQHGNMACVGYEMYMRLLEEAILEEKGGKSAPKIPECTIDFNIDAYIPENYISNSNQRLEAYKKISLIRTNEDMLDVSDELLDRFGPMPDSVASLVNISLLRSIASQAGLSRVEYKNKTIIYYPEKINVQAWSALAAENNGKLLMSFTQRPYISCRVKNSDWALDVSIKLLKSYLRIASQNNDASS